MLPQNIPSGGNPQTSEFRGYGPGDTDEFNSLGLTQFHRRLLTVRPAGRRDELAQASTFILSSISERCPRRNFSFLPGRQGCSSPLALIVSRLWSTAFLNSPP